MSQTQQIERPDSISSQDPHMEEKKKTKSRRPANTAFRQQRLKAWQPILTPKTVLPLFFIVGIIFAPIGALLFYASSQVQEISIDYTKCIEKAPVTQNVNVSEALDLEEIPSEYWNIDLKASATNPRWGKKQGEVYQWNYPNNVKHTETNVDVCIIQFRVPEDIKAPIYFYYRLTNFYQNHRRYVKSLEMEQLKGKARSASQIRGGECDPLETNVDGLPYYPCGLIANSMFNDTFESLTAVGENSQAQVYEMSENGISWSSEKDLYGETKYKWDEIAVPPNWVKRYPGDDDARKTYKETGPPDLKTWEPFQVWMRTAGLPTFSKLAKRNEKDDLKVGTYNLKIFSRFPVEKYGGEKAILISTRTVMGGKNPFLGIAYIVVGGICILLGAVFTATHLIKPRKLGDHTYLSWNNDQPSTATATGRSVRPGDTA